MNNIPSTNCFLIFPFIFSKKREANGLGGYRLKIPAHKAVFHHLVDIICFKN
jgi:hypothetical protein